MARVRFHFRTPECSLICSHHNSISIFQFLSQIPYGVLCRLQVMYILCECLYQSSAFIGYQLFFIQWKSKRWILLQQLFGSHSHIKLSLFSCGQWVHEEGAQHLAVWFVTNFSVCDLNTSVVINRRLRTVDVAVADRADICSNDGACWCDTSDLPESKTDFLIFLLACVLPLLSLILYYIYAKL